MKDKAFLKRMQLMGQIGNWTDMGAGHVRGYPGLVNTALQISEYIPKCDTFVEPFAGLGRISKHVKASRKILNDKSEYAVKILGNNFPDATITQLDFEDVVKQYDADVYFFDPPWSYTEYKKGARERAFCDRQPKEYYERILELMQGKDTHWFICGNKQNNWIRKNCPHTILIESKKKIMGGNIKTLVGSNRPFVRYHQETL